LAAAAAPPAVTPTAGLPVQTEVTPQTTTTATTASQSLAPAPLGGAFIPGSIGGTMSPGPVGGALVPGGGIPGTPGAVNVTGGAPGGLNNGATVVAPSVSVAPASHVVVTGATPLGGTLNGSSEGGTATVTTPSGVTVGGSGVIVTGAATTPAGGTLNSSGTGGVITTGNTVTPQ